MDHGLELINPDPGNIWKFDFYDFLVSWKYWKSSFPIFSYPGNTGNLIFLISHILEILEIEVCNILYNLDILEIEVCDILYNLEIRAAGGRLQGLCCAALDYFWSMFLEKRAW